MKRVYFFWYFLIFVLSLSATAHATKVGINNGGCIYTTIQAAVDAANDGDMLKVSEGTYNENIDINNRDISITGGYDASCASRSGDTISRIKGVSGSVVDIASSTISLSYFTISGGGGGGIHASSSAHVTLASTTVTGNSATSGGGIYVGGGATVRLTNNSTVYKNIVNDNGGGVFIDDGLLILDNSIIDQNYAAKGGGIYLNGDTSEVRINGSAITGNAAHRTDRKGGGIYSHSGTISLSPRTIISSNAAANGGGMYVSDNSMVTIIDAVVRNNKSDLAGGGIYAHTSSITMKKGYFNSNEADSDNNNTGSGGAIFSYNSNVTVDKITFKENSGLYGGAFYQTGPSAQSTLNNCLLHDNSITGNLGSAIRIIQGDLTLNHSTVVENSGALSAVTLPDIFTKNIYNSIISNNAGGGVSGIITNQRCNIDQSGNAGVAINPQFVSLASNDYHLQETSPAIDACSSSGLTNDLESKHRPIGGMYDMGAYEYGTYFPWNQFLPAILNSR